MNKDDKNIEEIHVEFYSPIKPEIAEAICEDIRHLIAERYSLIVDVEGWTPYRCELSYDGG